MVQKFKRNYRGKKLTSKTIYKKKVATSFHDLGYYIHEQDRLNI